MSEIVSEKIEIDSSVSDALVGSLSKIFKVNVITGEFIVCKDDGALSVGMPDDIFDIYTYMQRLVTDRIVYPEYAAACRRFANPEYVRKAVFSGEKRLVQSYRRRTGSGDKWVTFAIIATPDTSLENPWVLFTWREADSDAITLLDTLPTISSLYDKLIRINLTNNTYAPVIVDADEQSRLVGGGVNMNEWWEGYTQSGNIAAEDMGAFSALVKSGNLQKHFAEDRTPIKFSYRKKSGSVYRWTQLEITPSVEYSEENQIMLLSLKDIHEEHTAQLRSRQELIISMNEDALTGLYNRLKFNSDVEELKTCVFPLFACLYVDVNGLHEMNNHLGHQKGDEMLCCVADTLRKYFPHEYVYRIGGDEFVVMTTDLPLNIIDCAITQVRRELAENNYAVSVGIASAARGDGVEAAVAQAEQRMRNDKAAYYMCHGDRRREREMNEELEKMLLEKRNNDRFLNILTRQFSAVYCVDLVSDASHRLHDSSPFSEFLEKTGSSFREALQSYIERYVQHEYHGVFAHVLDYDQLDRSLSGGKPVEVSYQKMNGDTMILRILEVDRHPNAGHKTLWMFWKTPVQ